MSSHYPLNDVDLDFKRYAHQPFSGRDILISRIMEDLLNPSRVSPRTYLEVEHGFGLVKSQDRELGLDIQVMSRLLEMEWSVSTSMVAPVSMIQIATMVYAIQCAIKPSTLQQAIIELVQTHYFERDPLVHQAKRVFTYRDRDPRTASCWKHDMVTHLALFQKALLLQHHYSVFSGNSQLSSYNGPQNGELSLGSCFVLLPWAKQRAVRRLGFSMTAKSSNLHRDAPRRSQSLPSLERWGIENSSPRYTPLAKREAPHLAFFPHKSLSELDKLSRRRSLSRSHIRAMFTDKPEWIVEDTNSKKPRPRYKHPCSNCAQYTHATKNCPSNCGYCNSEEHRARSCTMKASNRCKCQPFPQFHRASKCHVQCSRRCGSPHPPGNYKHINAMLCSHRCCMCGIKGHSGTKCSLKTCPCGEQHLTQDCRWKVECSSKGCHYYLCSLHCKECGTKREKGSENAFVGRTCQNCLKNGISASARAPDPPS